MFGIRVLHGSAITLAELKPRKRNLDKKVCMMFECE